VKKIVWYSLRWDNIIGNLGIIIGAWIFGSILHDVIMKVSDETFSFPMATLFMFLGFLFLMIFSNWAEEVMQYNLSVSMGCTRRFFFCSYSIQLYLLSLIDVLVMLLLNRLDEFRVQAMFPNAELEVSLGFLFTPWLIFVLPLFALGIGLLMGGLGLRFGSNSRWIIIILWIAICLGISKSGQSELLEKAFSLPGYVYGLIAIGISLVFIVISGLFMRKQRVNI